MLVECFIPRLNKVVVEKCRSQMVTKKRDFQLWGVHIKKIIQHFGCAAPKRWSKYTTLSPTNLSAKVFLQQKEILSCRYMTGQD